MFSENGDRKREKGLEQRESLAIIKRLRRRTEEVVTGRTRNAFVGEPARGFESHRLRSVFSRNR